MRMSFDPRGLADFARYHGFHYAVCDPFALVKDIVVEMERGLCGDSSCLPMLPSYIAPVTRTPRGRMVIALDAGGTNLRAARIRFDESGKAVEEDARKAHMPGTKGQVSSERFFAEIADVVQPLFSGKEKPEGIGFCFSYPMETLENADGRLLAFSKEVDAPDVIGKLIGKGLADELTKRGVSLPDRLVMLNDTTAALLAGLAEIPADGGLSQAKSGGQGTTPSDAPGGPAIGFILGTGMNVAYPESRIPKIGFDNPASPQVVVLQLGDARVLVRQARAHVAGHAFLFLVTQPMAQPMAPRASRVAAVAAAGRGTGLVLEADGRSGERRLLVICVLLVVAVRGGGVVGPRKERQALVGAIKVERVEARLVGVRRGWGRSQHGAQRCVQRVGPCGEARGRAGQTSSWQAGRRQSGGVCLERLGKQTSYLLRGTWLCPRWSAVARWSASSGLGHLCLRSCAGPSIARGPRAEPRPRRDAAAPGLREAAAYPCPCGNAAWCAGGSRPAGSAATASCQRTPGSAGRAARRA